MFKKKIPKLKYSFIDNSILLSMETIEKNGFREIFRQQDNKSHCIQILCFNENTYEFKAFDRFKWMDEPFYEKGGCFSAEGWHYKKDLWTPILLHYTTDWLKSVMR